MKIISIILILTILGCGTLTIEPKTVCSEEKEINCTATWNQDPPDIICEKVRYCVKEELKWIEASGIKVCSPNENGEQQCEIELWKKPSRRYIGFE